MLIQSEAFCTQIHKVIKVLETVEDRFLKNTYPHMGTYIYKYMIVILLHILMQTQE